MRILEVINSLELAGAERLVHDLCLEFQRRRASGLGFPPERDWQSASSSSLRDHGHSGLLVRGAATPRRPAMRCASPNTCGGTATTSSTPTCFRLSSGRRVARRLSSPPERGFITTEHSFTTRRRRWFAQTFRCLAIRPVRCRLLCQRGGCRQLSHLAAAISGPDAGRSATASIRTGSPGRAGARRKRTRILSVGRCEPVKRHDVTLRALALPARCQPVDRGDGPCRRTNSAPAKPGRVPGGSSFSAAATTWSVLIPQCGVFVQSSDHEGFGLAALEAMACGLADRLQRHSGPARCGRNGRPEVRAGETISPLPVACGPSSDQSAACSGDVQGRVASGGAASRSPQPQIDTCRLYGMPPAQRLGPRSSRLEGS